uniref:Transposase Helix-turn-helix domain-containing protein n=1 Tax=Clytia hemisphaerica TaxID=252671 RepID=A0A7M5WKC9_9CNID
MTVRAARSKSPVKRRKIVYHDSSTPSTSSSSPNASISIADATDITTSPSNFVSTSCQTLSVNGAMIFADMTRESEVQFYTGFSSHKFKAFLSILFPMARVMHYWRPGKQVVDQALERRDHNITLRKLSMEQEVLLTLMRLRVGLLIEDLAFRFRISVGLASSIFTTWI